MADTNQNLVSFRLLGTLSVSGTEVKISNDILRDTAIAITDASITLTNEARTSFELVVGTIATGTLTLSKRGIKQDQTLTEDATLKKEWRPGTIAYVTLFASDTLDIDNEGGTATIKNDITFTGDNVFNGTSDFNAGVTIDNTLKLPTFADTNARDIVYSAPVTGNKCIISGIGEQYYEGGAWNTLGVGSPTPNASTIVSGKIEIATNAEMGAGTTTGLTGALLVPQNSQLVKTSSGAGDENKIPVLDSAGKITNFVNTASNTAAGVIRIATDIEATAGTLETVSINPKQVKDNYTSGTEIKIITFGNATPASTVNFTHSLGYVPKLIKIDWCYNSAVNGTGVRKNGTQYGINSGAASNANANSNSTYAIYYGAGQYRGQITNVTSTGFSITYPDAALTYLAAAIIELF